MALGINKTNSKDALGRTGRFALAAFGVLALAACQVPVSAKNAPSPSSVALPELAQPAPANGSEILSLASLIGLPRERIAEFFGEPGRVRKENPAEVWQYSGADCVVDFYMYEGNGGGLAVSFIEARDASALDTEPGRCFDDLLQRAAL